MMPDAQRTPEREYDPAVYSNTTVSYWDAEEEANVSYRLTWKDLAQRQERELAEMRKWQLLCWDLDRCEHGRHEGDVCSSCGGPSHGNLLIGHAPIGHGLSTEHIHSPERAMRYDPDTWRVSGPCRDPEQIGTPCPIGGKVIPVQANVLGTCKVTHNPYLSGSWDGSEPFGAGPSSRLAVTPATSGSIGTGLSGGGRC